MKFFTKLTSHPLFSGSVVMVGGNMLTNIINYFYHLIMGRLMGPLEYGVLASMYSILYIVSIIPSSTSFAMVKFISTAGDKQELATIYQSLKKLVRKIALIFLLIIILVSPVISNYLQIKHPFSIILIGPIVFFSLMCLVNQATSQGLLRFAGSAVPSLVSAVLKLIVGVGLVLLGCQTFGAMIGVLGAMAVAYWLSLGYVKTIKSVRYSSFNLNPFLKFALPTLIQAVAFTSMITIDMIFVKHFFSPFEAGLYAALSMLGKIIYFAVSPVTATMFPIVSGRRAKNETFAKIFFVALILTLGGSSVILLFYKFFPTLAINLLYGSQYLLAQKELVLMGLFMTLYTLSYFMVNFLLSLGETGMAYLALLFAVLQASGIYLWHASLSQVIQISIWSALGLLITSMMFIGYNQLWLKKNFFR